MPYADIEKRRICVKESQRKWRREHPEEARADYKDFQDMLSSYTPEQLASKRLRRRVRNRIRAYLILGGKCRMCGCTDFRLFTLNHKNGDGSKDNRCPEQKYADIINFRRNDLEILCWNCQNLFEWERAKKNYSSKFKDMLEEELKKYKIEQNWF